LHLQIACGYWAPYTKDHAPFDARIVAELYQKVSRFCANFFYWTTVFFLFGKIVQELLGSAFAIRRIVLLEFSQYLENFLWPNYDAATSSLEHVMSIVIMLNEKFRERVPTWLVSGFEFSNCT
jgi:intron-binding protein aquarius